MTFCLPFSHLPVTACPLLPFSSKVCLGVLPSVDARTYVDVSTHAKTTLKLRRPKRDSSFWLAAGNDCLPWRFCSSVLSVECTVRTCSCERMRKGAKGCERLRKDAKGCERHSALHGSLSHPFASFQRHVRECNIHVRLLLKKKLVSGMQGWARHGLKAACA